MMKMDALTFWREWSIIYPLLILPAITEAVTFGSSIRREPPLIDDEGHRPALLDEHGRRWLLDGSGEVA